VGSAAVLTDEPNTCKTVTAKRNSDAAGDLMGGV